MRVWGVALALLVCSVATAQLEETFETGEGVRQQRPDVPRQRSEVRTNDWATRFSLQDRAPIGAETRARAAFGRDFLDFVRGRDGDDRDRRRRPGRDGRHRDPRHQRGTPGFVTKDGLFLVDGRFIPDSRLDDLDEHEDDLEEGESVPPEVVDEIVARLKEELRREQEEEERAREEEERRRQRREQPLVGGVSRPMAVRSLQPVDVGPMVTIVERTVVEDGPNSGTVQVNLRTLRGAEAREYLREHPAGAEEETAPSEGKGKEEAAGE